MSIEPFVAEIALFGFNFAPRGWAWCDGQLMPIAQNTALFSLLGTTYGGNGQTNFGLPNLNGRAALHHGQGPGLSNRSLGETGGAEVVTVTWAEMPDHAHSLMASSAAARTANPATSVPATTELELYHSQPGAAAKPMGDAGGGGTHPNMQPYLALNYAIALQGIFPQRP